jgi:hypothetical protein
MNRWHQITGHGLKLCKDWSGKEKTVVVTSLVTAPVKSPEESETKVEVSFCSVPECDPPEV